MYIYLELYYFCERRTQIFQKKAVFDSYILITTRPGLLVIFTKFSTQVKSRLNYLKIIEMNLKFVIQLKYFNKVTHYPTVNQNWQY